MLIKAIRQMMVFLLLGMLITLPLSTGFSPSHTVCKELEDSMAIYLDCTNISGIIHRFGHINDGPAPIKNESSFADLTRQYQEIGITTIRTHDLFGPTDMTAIFPNWSADPTVASNYHFGTSDQLITCMINTGCQIYYRLGESASNNHTLRTPPVNFTVWAEVCKHITMHYNEGWNNGFFYNIQYWEVWNEPDLSGFWNGTAEQYYDLYRITAEALKAHNSSLKIGGPCTSSVVNSNYTERFLQYVKDHEVPLDFFSWHRYPETPYDFYRDSLYVRQLLDSYGFIETENINSEWNIDILSPQRDKDNAKNAAFTACSLTVFQDATLDYAFRYRGNQDRNWLMRVIGLDLSLFTASGIYKRPALIYRIMNDLSRDTPLRIATPIMDGSTGITYLAGVSADKTNVSILVSSFNEKDTQYTLEMNSLPWETTYKAVRYLIDEAHHLEIMQNTLHNTSSFTTTQTLQSNSIHFYRLTNSSVIPPEGPEVARIPLLLRFRFLDPLTRILAILLVLFIFQ